MSLLEVITKASAISQTQHAPSDYPIVLDPDSIFAKLTPKLDDPNPMSVAIPMSGWQISQTDSEIIELGKKFFTKLKKKLKNPNNFAKAEFLATLNPFLESIREKIGISIGVDSSNDGYTQILMKKVGSFMGKDVAGLVLDACVGLEIWELVGSLIANGLLPNSCYQNLVPKVVAKRRSDLLSLCVKHASDLGSSELLLILKYFLDPPKDGYTSTVDDKDLQIRAYYAGHVLGAAMFYAKVGDAAMVYTGDYNMTPDRHLGAAQIERLNLDLLISESTYGTTIRDSKYAREREFLRAVHKCIAGGGKVLIPTFALGRAQELCILLEDYWERMNLKVPIYFSAGLTLQANMYYKMLISWTSQKVKETYSTRNAFDFKNAHKFDRSMIDAPGPCVLFATPGMISGGFSLEVFKHWAPSEMNLVTLPGYCVAGTIGHKLMSGKPTKIDLDKDTQIDVRCQIHHLSFSPHTDAKGIMDLIKFLSPKNVILVHGEKPKMATLKGKIQSELGIQCYDPANNETVSISSTHYVKALASDAFIRSCSNPNFKFSKSSQEDEHGSNSRNNNFTPRLRVSDERVAEGVLVTERNKKAKVVHQDELLLMLGEKKHQVQFAYCCPVDIGNLGETKSSTTNDGQLCKSETCSWRLRQLSAKLSNEFSQGNIQDFEDHLQVESFHVSICLKNNCPYRLMDVQNKSQEAAFFCCSWGMADEKLAWKIISICQNFNVHQHKQGCL